MHILPLIPLPRLSPIKIHLLLQEATQLGPPTPPLNLCARHRGALICGFDRRHGRRVVRGWPVGRKVLRLDLLTPSSDRGLVLRVHGVVGGCVAAVDGVVEGAAEGFGCALREFVSRLQHLICLL
jgi:hypothetical protein